MDREGLGPASTSREGGIELRAEGVEGLEQSVELWEVICVYVCVRNRRIAGADWKEMGKVSRGWGVVENLWFMKAVRRDSRQKSMC